MAEGIGDEEKADIMATFKMFDSDGDGKLSKQELSTVIRAYFMVASDKQLGSFLRELDTDESGYVDYHNFETFILKTNMSKPTPEDPELLEAFNVFDKNGDGVIDAAEFREIMTSVGDNLTTEEVELMMKDADTDGNGKIDYKEFCAHLSKNLLY
ncbi:calmodulin-A-like isoform X1 [Gigantopelta aegis]|uniref:calmodulin-A-like isoform X1 n=1 Tax=Gigantopelta aegis TaxID=1735272 RepID=UPI001B88A1A6|nr:calmodulin-A-like isoform X1 [Gigantopelta aegis]